MVGQWPHPCPTRCLRGTLHDSFLMWQCNKYPNLDMWAARVDTMCIGLRSMVQVLLSASHTLLLAALAPARLLPLHLLVWLLLLVVVRLLLLPTPLLCGVCCCPRGSTPSPTKCGAHMPWGDACAAHHASLYYQAPNHPDAQPPSLTATQPIAYSSGGGMSDRACECA